MTEPNLRQNLPRTTTVQIATPAPADPHTLSMTNYATKTADVFDGDLHAKSRREDIPKIEAYS
jgi:hypothetical protein